MSEMVTKYQVVVCTKEEGKLLFAKSFDSLEDARHYYRSKLIEKYHFKEFRVYYSKYRTAV